MTNDETEPESGEGRPRADRRANSSAIAPHRLEDFTGRQREIAAVLAALHAAEPDVVRPGTASSRIVLLHGSPGIGKTSTAVEALKRYSSPGADPLYVDLGGIDPDPPSPRDVVLALLRQLPSTSTTLPTDLDDALLLWRRVSADHPAPLLLDDAANEGQLRLLLASTSAKTIVVTSRRSLSGLDGLSRISMDRLPPADSVRFLERMIPVAQRSDGSLSELAQLCDHMPLALRIAGNRIASRPRWSVSDLVLRLRDEARRLRSLVAGDQTVEAAFRLSYDQLDDGQAKQFRVLSLIGGMTFDARIAAAAAGTDVRDSEDRLDDLVELGLIEARGGDRYAVHDLIRLFADARFRADEDPADAVRLRADLRAWLMRSTERAGAWFEPTRVADGPSPGNGLAFRDADAAQEWLRMESEHWFAAYRSTAAAGLHDVVTDVADALHWFSDLAIGWGHWRELFTLSAAAAEAVGDPHRIALHLGYRAWAEVLEAADYDAAAETAGRARSIADAAGDTEQIGWARVYETWASMKAGRLSGVPELLKEAIDAFVEANDPDGTVQVQGLLGQYDRATGRADLAAERYRAIVQAVRAHRDGVKPNILRFNEAMALSGLAENLLLLDAFEESLDASIESVRIAESIALPGRAVFVVWRAAARQRLGDRVGAADDAAEARRIAVDEGGQALQSQVESALERAGLLRVGEDDDPTGDVSENGRPDAAAWSGRARLAGAGSGLAALPLRGRHDVSRVFDDAVIRLDRGRSQVIVLRGAAGVGKTRLISEALDGARLRGWMTVVCAPDVDAHLVPMGPLIDAALSTRPALLEREVIDDLVRRPDLRFWLTQALTDALEAVATQRAIVFAVDDLQWCDAGSLASLRTMIERLADLPIMFVVAVRTGQHDPHVQRVVDTLSRSGSLVDVEPLTDAAVSAMVEDLVGAAPDSRLDQAMSRAENLPLLVVELVQGLLEENILTIVEPDVPATPRPERRIGSESPADERRATISGDATPTRFGTSVRERLMRLSPRTSSLIAAASVLGRRFTLDALAALAEVPVGDIVEAIGEAVRADILVEDPHSDRGHGLGFRHDVIREAAEAGLTPSVRALLRRRAADIRVRFGEPVLAVAASVADSAESGDDDAVLLLRDAAVQLTATDAASAAELAIRAVVLAAGAERFAPVLADLVPVLWSGGLVTEVRELASTLRGSLDPDAEARIGLVIARLQTESSFADALDTCAAALTIDGVSADLRAQLLAVTALNTANIGDHDRLPAAIETAREAAAAAEDGIATATVDATESVLMLYRDRFDDARALIERAAARWTASTGSKPALWVPEGLWPAFLLNTIGRGPEALDICDTGLVEATRSRNAPAMAFWMMVRARILFDLGRLEEARTQAETVVSLADELALGDFTRATAGMVLFRVALYTGDRETVDRRLPIVRAMADGASLRRAGSWLLAIAADDSGDRAGAVEASTMAIASLEDPTPSMTTPADLADDADLARMSIRSGRQDRLAVIRRVTERRAAANPGHPIAVAVDHWVQGLADDDSRLLELAVDLLRAVHRPLVLACSLEDLGHARKRASLPGVVEAWEEATRLYESSGAIRDAGRTRQLLREIGVVRRPKTDSSARFGLTTRELHVVARLAGGATTQQIATDLFLSPHTVVTHIRHVYAKWGVNSRKALVERYREVVSA